VARTAVLALLLVLLGGASAAAQSGADTFRLPSGNVYCAYEHYSFSAKDLRCEIRTKIKPTPANGCDDGYILRQTGPARSFCAGDTIYDRNALVLAYGTTRQFGVFKCTSGSAGLKCVNASGDGFFLSKERSYTLKEAAARYGAFKTPSGNIVCGYGIAPDGSASMECGIKSGLKPPPRPIRCDAGDPNDKRVSLRDTGRSAPVLCAGDPGPLLPQIVTKASVLAYGRTVRFGRIACSSAANGLTCRNGGGHGFFLSRERWRMF
jgi:Family of unknown function (DUF6636)